MALTPRQRLVLTIVAVFGFAGPNGVFLYYLLVRSSELVRALTHPAALAFVFDSFVAMVLLAAFIAKRSFGRYGWPSFVALSLLGGLAFSIPVFVLLNQRRDAPPAP